MELNNPVNLYHQLVRLSKDVLELENYIKEELGDSYSDFLVTEGLNQIKNHIENKDKLEAEDLYNNNSLLMVSDLCSNFAEEIALANWNVNQVKNISTRVAGELKEAIDYANSQLQYLEISVAGKTIRIQLRVF